MILRSLLLGCLASPAFAECPVAGDLSTGIRATMDDGTYEDFTTLGNGLVEMLGYYDDDIEFVTRYFLAHGTYVVQAIDMEADKAIVDSRWTYSYPVNPGELPPPEADARWSGKVGGLDSGGAFQETHSHRWGAVTTASYGDCSYDMILGTLFYKGDGYEFSEEVHYLPELGISLLTRFFEEAEDVDDVYTYVSIEKLEN